MRSRILRPAQTRATARHSLICVHGAISLTMRNLLLLLLSTALWAALFRAVCALSATHVRVYRNFSRAEQGDWSSRCVMCDEVGYCHVETYIVVAW